MSDLPARLERIANFDLRAVAPFVEFGTASDRYAGWIGQIYSEAFANTVTSRSRSLGGKRFRERTVPIESVAEYFEHFDVLELDFTFYRPLLEPNGNPSTNFFVLQRYAEHAPSQARFFLKAPQQFFARTLRRSVEGKAEYVDNPDYLDANACRRRFLEPALDLLGDRLLGVLFEQEYQRKSETPGVQEYIGELDAFFGSLSSSPQAHLELRSPHLLEPAYFAWLESRGLGFVFSHWTWLPPVREQWARCGKRFTAADGRVVARLLTPLRTKYADAYAAAYPFDKPVPEIVESEQAKNMVLDAAALSFQAELARVTAALIVNNRAWGNAPALAQTIAERILHEADRRSSEDA